MTPKLTAVELAQKIRDFIDRNEHPKEGAEPFAYWLIDTLVLPLQKENERLREALKEIKTRCDCEEGGG